ncbi:MAG: hypothetical protein RDV48_10660 [Candidatus Eremiobacteraeota bacterium]|nr:hypothetical protein [Candidatus Eremiobacteraeota bacterium]
MIPEGFSVFIFTGGLGSGKTEIAANFSLKLAGRGGNGPVHLVDLDIVKPYFRSRHLAAELEATAVKLVAPPAPYLHADLPLVPPEVRAILASGTSKVVLDVGGDDVGARVLGCFQDELSRRAHRLYYVVNISRPLAKERAEILSMMRDIEGSSGLRITGIVNNTHLMGETTPEIVLEGARTARALAAEIGVPLAFHCIKEDMVEPPLEEPVFKLRLYFHQYFESRQGGKRYAINRGGC